MKMRFIVHNKNSGQLYAKFLHPVTRLRVYRSIGTTDEVQAARTSQALQQFIAVESWHTPTKVHEAIKLDAAAARLFYDPLKPQDHSWFAMHGTYCNWPMQDEDGGWVDEVISIEEAAKRARLIEQENAELKLKVSTQEIQIEALTEKCGTVVVSTKTFAEASKAYLEWGEVSGGRRQQPWSAEHLRKRTVALAFWQKELSLESLSQIKLDVVERVTGRLTKAKKAPATVAKYAEAICAFCDWCVDRGYLSKDPLKFNEPFDATPETERRALTVEEVQRLVLKCRPQRRLLYLTAVCSGLRANELRQTEVRQLRDEGIELSKRVAKSRKQQIGRLPAYLVRMLRAEAAGKGPNDKLLLVPKHLNRGFATDLKRAGIEPGEGTLSFHALRTTYTTLVNSTGADAKVTQTLARHSTPQLTFDHYVKTSTAELGATVEKVGALVRPSAS